MAGPRYLRSEDEGFFRPLTGLRTGDARIFLGIVLSRVPHDMLYGPQAALIAECFTPRLRYSGA